MNELIRKMALSLIQQQLALPATRDALHKYVDAQVAKEVEAAAGKLESNDNPFIKAVGVELRSLEFQKALLDLVNEEFDNLVAIVVSKVG